MRIDQGIINRRIGEFMNFLKRAEGLKNTENVKYELNRIIKEVVIRHIKINERKNDD